MTVVHDRRDNTYSDRLNDLHGAGDVDALFEHHPTTGTPWPSAGRLKAVKDYDEHKVGAMLDKPPGEDFREFDPRNLRSTQPEITRAGVEHYLGPEYDRTGKTFQHDRTRGNQFPVVYSRTEESGDISNMILSGHHRAAAALLQGKQFKARHVEGGYGESRSIPWGQKA